jgi:hypothetical protein
MLWDLRSCSKVAVCKLRPQIAEHTLGKPEVLHHRSLGKL